MNASPRYLTQFSVLVGASALLAIALAGCSPSGSPSPSDANQATNTPGQSGSDNSSNNGAASNEVANSAIISNSASNAAPPTAALASVWVPGTDDKLHLRPVSKAALDTQKKFKDPTEAFNDLIRMAPKYFPPHTKVLEWHDDGKAVSLNFNRAFIDTSFWSKRGEGRTQLAVYALVNSAANSAKTPLPVVLQAEKRPISTLGEMDTSDTIEANPKLETTGSAASTTSATPYATGAGADQAGAGEGVTESSAP